MSLARSIADPVANFISKNPRIFVFTSAATATLVLAYQFYKFYYSSSEKDVDVIDRAKVINDNAKDQEERRAVVEELDNSLMAQLNTVKSNNANLVQVNQSLVQSTASLTQAKVSLENESLKLAQEKAELLSEKQKAVDLLEREIEKLKEEKDNLTQTITNLERTNSDEMQRLESKIEKLEREIARLNDHPLDEDLKTQIRDHQKTIQKLRPENIKLIEERDELNSQIQFKQNEIERLKLELSAKELKVVMDVTTSTPTLVVPPVHSIQIKPDDSNELNKDGYIDKLIKNLSEKKPTEVLLHPRNGGSAGSVDLISTFRAVTSDVPSRALAGANLSFCYLLKGLDAGTIKLVDNDKEKLLNLIIQNNRYIRQDNDKNPTTFIKAAERFELKQYRSAMEFFANISYTLSAAENIFPSNGEISAYKQFAKIFLADSIAHYIYNLNKIEEVKKITVTNNFKIPMQSSVQNINKTVVDELIEILSSKDADYIIDQLNDKTSFMASKGVFEIFTYLLNSKNECDVAKFSTIILRCCNAFNLQVKEKSITTQNAKAQYAQALHHISVLKQQIKLISDELLPPALPPRPVNVGLIKEEIFVAPVAVQEKEVKEQAPPLPPRNEQITTQTSSNLFSNPNAFSQSALKPTTARPPVLQESLKSEDSPMDALMKKMKEMRDKMKPEEDDDNNNNEVDEFADDVTSLKESQRDLDKDLFKDYLVKKFKPTNASDYRWILGSNSMADKFIELLNRRSIEFTRDEHDPKKVSINEENYQKIIKFISTQAIGQPSAPPKPGTGKVVLKL